MATRSVVLIGERDERLGSLRVHDGVMVIRHHDDLFIRTSKGIRSSGGGMAVVFELTDVYVRDRLDPI